MRWLITGGSGCVGASLAQQLLSKGEEVVVQVRTMDRLLEKLRPHANEAFLGDPAALRNAMEGAQVVVHCAAVQHPASSPRALRWVNIAGTENVLRAAQAAGVERFVHLSCDAVTLVNEDRVHWDEKRQVDQPLGLLAKERERRSWGEELVIAQSRAGFETVVLRPGTIWGPGDRTRLPAWVHEAQTSGGVSLFGAGENLLSLAHVRNVVNAIELAASAKEVGGQVFYLGDDEFVTARHFFTELSKAFGLPAPRGGRSLRMAFARAWLAERFGGEGPTAAELVVRGRSTHFNLLKAFEQLGYTPGVKFEEAMAEWAKSVAAEGGLGRLLQRARRPEPAHAVDAMVEAAGGD